MKKSTFFLITSLLISTAEAQEKDNLIKSIVKKVFSEEGDTTRGASFMVLPAIGYAQETGFEYGLAGTYNFYTDKNNPNSKTSNIIVIGTMTTKSQKKININTDIWTKGNEYHILGEIRLRDWPFNFYGIGNDTWQIDEDYLDQTLYRVKLDVEKKVAHNFYLGVNTNYENIKFKDIETGGVFEEPNILDRDGGQFLNFGVSALYDSRDATTYSTKGFYSRLKYAYAPTIFKKDDFHGHQIDLDIKGFIPLHKKLTLASQAIYRGTMGDNMPFYVKRDLGGDNIMRGYYLGRYKDNNYIAAQTELRYRFHPRFGIASFVGTGSTFSDSNKLRLVPSYGAGARYFFSIEHSSSIRFDYAYGEKRFGEKRQSGFYLSVSEAF